MVIGLGIDTTNDETDYGFCPQLPAALCHYPDILAVYENIVFQLATESVLKQSNLDLCLKSGFHMR